jgi:hypothetical protein
MRNLLASTIVAILLLAILASAQAPANRTLIDLQTQVKNILLPKNGGTGGTDFPTGSVNIVVENPLTTDSGKFQFTPKQNVTAQSVYCSVDQGNIVSINLEERTASAPNSTGTAILAVPLPCTGSGASSNNFAIQSLAAGQPVALIITSENGSPGIVRVALNY